MHLFVHPVCTYRCNSAARPDAVPASYLEGSNSPLIEEEEEFLAEVETQFEEVKS